MRDPEQGMDVITAGLAVISGGAARPVVMLISKAEGTEGGRGAPRLAFPLWVPVTPALQGITSLED